MGLRNGARAIIEKMQNGLYNRLAPEYTIYVDGELMRYKGMIDTNLGCHNACEEIANTSVTYMMGMVHTIEDIMSPFKPNEIVVYMDATERVKNKIVRTESRMQHDVALIRGFFIKICQLQPGVRVKCLERGESELQMYLQRKRENHLNIFLTSDSDMIAILYGHVPVGCDHDLSKCRPDDDTNYNISNKNKIYSDPPNDLRDSCLWVNCSYKTVAIGCDFSAKRLRLQRLQFLTFIAMCGTDFTTNMITETIIKAILNADDTDIALINEQDTLRDIVTAIMYTGVKNGGKLKPKRRLECSRSLNDYLINVQYYIDYIESGIMTEYDFVDVDGSMACREIFVGMGYEGTFRKAELMQWCQNYNFQ